jgi:hypothetical protein
METLLALALGLVAGLIAGVLGGVSFAGRTFGRAVRRELDTGRVTRDIAERLTDLKSV